MAHSYVSIDEFVNYREEYLERLGAERCRVSADGTRLIAHCPFHNDTHTSFSVDLSNGQCKCFAGCIDGNLLSFDEKFYGITTREADRRLHEKYHYSVPRSGASQNKPVSVNGGNGNEKNKKTSGLKPYSLEQYAQDKRLPEDFLKEQFGLYTSRPYGNRPTCLICPYWNQDSVQTATRKRYGDKQFLWKPGDKTSLYNLWRLPEYQNTEHYALLAEGESDTHALVYMGYPALGCPGAQNFRAEDARALQNMDIYIHQEPEKSGRDFVSKICRTLDETDFTGQLYVWRCSELGYKDPSDVLIALGRDEAGAKIRQLLDGAEAVSPAEFLKKVSCDGIPTLKNPPGFQLTDAGIYREDSRTGNMIRFCPAPLTITRRLRNIETGEEKIQLSCQRDGKWQNMIFPRSTVFVSRNITALADLGFPVSSENAKHLVSYLSALEAANMTGIPIAESVSRFGWHGDNRFYPYMAANLTLDVEPGRENIAAGCCTKGTLDEWVEAIAPYRDSSPLVRFIIACAFAAPLLYPLQVRGFMVNLWCDSGGGKTAVLKAAESVCGDPLRLMRNYNTTLAGLERTAAMYCDMLLGLDERQMVNGKQQEQILSHMIYMLANGQGRTRASRDVSLKAVSQWRTICVSTGEEPIITDTSMGGAVNRVLELYGKPFDNEADAVFIHRFVEQHYGAAGEVYIPYLVDLVQSNPALLRETYQKLCDNIMASVGGSQRQSVHIHDIALVALGDFLAGIRVFQDDRTVAWNKANAMAAAILRRQRENSISDPNENALQALLDWIWSNRKYFDPDAPGKQLGFFENGISSEKVYINPSAFNEALKDAGFHSPLKIKKYLAERGLITSRMVKGKIRYDVQKRYGGGRPYFIEFFLDKASGAEEEVKEDDFETPPELKEITDYDSYSPF